MDIELRIRIVLLMAKFESQSAVLRVLKSEGIENLPSITAISNLYEKFCQFGTVLDLPKSGRPKISDEESTEPIRQIMEIAPKSTLSAISAATGINTVTISRRLKVEIGMKPYKIQIHQELQEDDFDRRIETSQKLLPILRDPSYKHLFLFSDEATFNL